MIRTITTTLLVMAFSFSALAAIKAPKTEKSHFLQMCEDEKTSAAARHTINVIMKKIQGNDCKSVDKKLSSEVKLNLSGERITDLSPLSGLTSLVSLFLWGNQITDVSPLAGLTSLEILIIFENKVTDVSSLAGLTSLRGLALWDNQITNVKPLADLASLEYLELSKNPIINNETHCPTNQKSYEVKLFCTDYLAK